MTGYQRQDPDWQTGDSFTETTFDAWDQALYELKRNPVDVRDYGGGSVTVAAINAAVDDLPSLGGVIRIPPGVHDLSGVIDPIPAGDKAVILEGAGQGTVLRWLSDPGDDWVLQWAQGGGLGLRSMLKDIYLQGPYSLTYSVTQPGTADGIRWAAQVDMVNVKVTGFRYGITAEGDHKSTCNTRSTDNWINLWFPAGTLHGETIDTNQGNDDYAGVNVFTSAGLASIGIDADANGLQGATVAQMHLGYGPICVYLESGGTAGPGIGGNQIQAFSCENYSYMMIFSPDQKLKFRDNAIQVWYDTGTVNSYAFSGDSLPGTYTKSLGGVTINRDYRMQVNILSNNKVYYHNGIGHPSPGDVGWIKGEFSGNVYEGTSWSGITGVSGKPTTTGTTAGNRLYIGNKSIADFYRTGAALAQYELVQQSGGFENDCTKYSTGSPIGVAQHAIDINERGMIVTKGKTFVKATGTINRNAYVKADTGNAGKVISDGTTKTALSIGICTLDTSGEAGAGLCEMEMF